MKARSALSTRTFLSILFFGGVILLAAPILLRQVHASDIWKALYSGRYLTLFRHFPHHSTFSYSPVEDLLIRDAYNWLGNLTLLGLHQLGGIVGLQLLRVGLGLLVPAFLYAQSGYSKSPLIFLLLILSLYGISQKLRLRTAIFAVPFSLVMMWLWLNYDRANRPVFLYGLPLVFLLWGNSHGSYIIGIGFFLCLLFGKGLESGYQLVTSGEFDTSRWLRLTLVSALVLGTVTFVKPYPDYKLAKSVARVPVRALSLIQGSSGSNTPPAVTAGQKKASWLEALKRGLQQSIAPIRGFRTDEFKSPFGEGEHAFVKANFIFLILVIPLLFCRPFYSYLPLVLATILLGLAHLRSLPYISLVLGSLVFDGDGRNLLPDWSSSALVEGTALFLTMTGGLLILIVTSGGLSNLTNQPHHRVGFGKTEKFSGSIPRYVLTNYPRRRAANSFNTGTYLIWKWWPYKRVFVDSKSSAYQQRFWRTLSRQGAMSILLRNRITLFVIENYNPNLRQLQRHPNWVRETSSGGLHLYRNEAQFSGQR